MHPTQKPEALLHRVLLATSQPGDVILDPFFGSGTTGAVAKYLGRSFIGIEADETYIKAARQRIDQVAPAPDEALEVTQSAKALPRIPFGSLIESGMIRPGTQLFGPSRRYQARVRADGSLKAGSTKAPITGSIHQIGAHVQGAQACNGWTFWHVESDDKLISIDDLRNKMRDQKVH